MTTKVKSQTEQIEAATGEKVQRLAVPIDQLLKQGVLVNLQVGRWRAATSLSLADLGVKFDSSEAQDAAARILRPGQRLLMPLKLIHQADSIESCIRTTLSVQYAQSHGSRAFAYRTRWGAFVPAASFADWKAVFEAWKTKYFDIRDEICNGYDSWVAEITNDYLSVAADTQQRLRKQGVAVPPWDEMKQATLAWLRRNIPSVEHIRDSFICTYDLAYIPFSAELAKEADKLVIAGLTEEKVAAMRAMHADVVAHEREARERVITEFEGAVRGQLYGIVNEALSSLLRMVDRAGIDGRENIGKRASAKIAFIKSQVASLDLFEDADLRRQIGRLETVTASPEAIGAAAKELRTYLEAQLESLELDLPKQRREIEATPVVELGTRRKRQDLATSEAPADLSLRRTRKLS